MPEVMSSFLHVILVSHLCFCILVLSLFSCAYLISMLWHSPGLKLLSTLACFANMHAGMSSLGETVLWAIFKSPFVLTAIERIAFEIWASRLCFHF